MNIPTDPSVTAILTLGIYLVWTLIWKGLALYKSGKNEQKGWFITMLILNTMGILPIIYLIINRRKK